MLSFGAVAAVDDHGIPRRRGHAGVPFLLRLSAAWRRAAVPVTRWHRR